MNVPLHLHVWDDTACCTFLRKRAAWEGEPQAFARASIESMYTDIGDSFGTRSLVLRLVRAEAEKYGLLTFLNGRKYLVTSPRRFTGFGPKFRDVTGEVEQSQATVLGRIGNQSRGSVKQAY